MSTLRKGERPLRAEGGLERRNRSSHCGRSAFRALGEGWARPQAHARRRVWRSSREDRGNLRGLLHGQNPSDDPFPNVTGRVGPRHRLPDRWRPKGPVMRVIHPCRASAGVWQLQPNPVPGERPPATSQPAPRAPHATNGDVGRGCAGGSSTAETVGDGPADWLEYLRAANPLRNFMAEGMGLWSNLLYSKALFSFDL